MSNYVKEWKGFKIGDQVMKSSRRDRGDVLKEGVIYIIKRLQIESQTREHEQYVELNDGKRNDWFYIYEIIPAIKGLCKGCINGCKENDKEQCDFKE